ncbi:MAG TPA: putative Ig domain-containing protein [Candidatus Acidoferrum sp.]|nr:putative Ig domain-containing protein [Candidatus Acidoferrum sp.]
MGVNRGSQTPLTWALLGFSFFAAGCGGTSSVAPPPPPPPPPEIITITTSGNLQCVQNVPFTLTLQAQGNSSPLTWTIISGQLPMGLTLDSSSGIISGTPTSGPGAVTIQAADAKGNTSKQFNFLVWTKLTINPVTPPPAHLNAPYSLSFSAQASSGIANWTISAGQLPPGLTLVVNGNAQVSGSPTQAGSFTFTIQAQDYTIPQTATLSVTIVVDTQLAITKATLKNGGQNQVYADSFTAVNGTMPLHWSISGNFPAGLSLNASTGQITGTPSDFGGFVYSVSVSDSSSTTETDSGQGILNIAEQMQIVGSLNPAYIGQPYYSGFVAIGGSYPYTWTFASGTLPQGLTFYADGNLIGTPTQLGSSTFVLQVTDSGTPPYVLTKQVTLNVVPTLLSVFGNPLSPAPVNVLYHSQIPASGGTPPYSWSISSGQLPPGINLDPATGYLDGTPTQIGTYNFVAMGTDSGNPVQTATANVFIQIQKGLGRNDTIATATPLGNSASLQIPIPLSISPYLDPINALTPNPDTDFYKLVANGGSLVHTETFSQRSWGADTLDSVIEILDGSGQRISSCGQPAYVSPCLNDNLDSTTLDSALDFKVPGASSTQTTFYLHVFDWRGDARPDMQYYLNISGVIEPLAISPSTLGAGATRGVAYQQQFTSKGGSGSVIWSIGGGALPPGWSLNSTGLLSGTATTNGFYTFAVKATDSGSPPETASVQYTLQIADPLVITSPAIWPNACFNKPYSFTIQTSGGIAPIRFGFISNAWIAVNLNQNTGTFSGIAGVTGTFTGTVSAIDSAQPISGQAQNVSFTVATTTPPCP